MVIPDPEHNPFYLLSDRARAAYRRLYAEGENVEALLLAITRALEMGTTARNPFVYERHDPDADPHRILNVYWQELHISFRNLPDDPRYEVVDIEVTPESNQPGMLFP